MKTLFNFIIAILFSLIAFINTNAMNTPTDDRTYAIDTLMVNVPSEIHIYKSDDFGISIKAPNKHIYDNVKWELKDQMLIINFDDMYMIEDQLINSNDIKINIGLPDKVKCIKTNPNLQITKTI